MQTLTINATLSNDEEEADDFLAERGVDIEVPDGTNHRELMALLFDGFVDRLKAAGIVVGDVTNFT